MGKWKIWTLKIRRCWAAEYQQLLKYSELRKIYVERICQADLKIGCITSAEWKIQTTYNYKNLYKLMKIAPKLMNYRANMTYFILNHDILFNYFNEENEEQPWKRSVPCNCDVCNSYFTEQTITSWSINIKLWISMFRM